MERTQHGRSRFRHTCHGKPGQGKHGRAPKTFAPSSEDVLSTLAFFFGDVPEKLNPSTSIVEGSESVRRGRIAESWLKRPPTPIEGNDCDGGAIHPLGDGQQVKSISIFELF